VSRDYRVATSKSTAGGLYIQGNTEHSHGLTSSLLSNIAVRSGEILRSIDSNRLSPVGDAMHPIGALA
jgi:L-ornithine N5-oxygenase